MGELLEVVVVGTWGRGDLSRGTERRQRAGETGIEKTIWRSVYPEGRMERERY